MGRRQEPDGAARTAKAGFSEVVLVCRKCAKRQDVDRKRLGRALKRVYRETGREWGSGKVRVVETGCLGPCPKRMLTLATAQSLARRRVVLIDPSLDALGPGALGLETAPPASSPGPAPVGTATAGDGDV